MQNRVRARTWRVASAFATALVVATGCSGGGGHRASTTTTTGLPADTACKLVPAADATRLFGGEAAVVSPDVSRAGGAASVCVYDVAGTSGQLLQVRVYTNDQYYARAEHADAVDVTGLGDRAFVSKTGPSGLVDCQFVKSNRVYSFAYSNLTGDAPTKADALVALARQVAGRA